LSFLCAQTHNIHEIIKTFWCDKIKKKSKEKGERREIFSEKVAI
jgi:hypothetical protein